MIYCADINLLLYAHHDQFPEHPAAREWLSTMMQGEGLALPWSVLLGFVRLSVKKGLLTPPQPLPEAWSRVQQLLDTRRIWLVEPGHRHRDILSDLLPLVKGQGNEVSDAHLAAIAIEHRLTLCTNDGGFDRFVAHGLRLHKPLQ